MLDSESAAVGSRLADLVLVSVGIHLEYLAVLVRLVVGSRLVACRMSLVLVQVDDRSHIGVVVGVP